MSVSFTRTEKRQQLKEQHNIELYEVLLDEDREHSAFASSFFHQSLQTLSVEEQKKIQLGTQWINSFASIHPVMIGIFAEAFTSPNAVPLSLPIEFSIRHNYHSIAHVARTRFNAEMGKDYFEIKEFGLRVRHEPGSGKLLTALYTVFFGAKVLIDNIEDMGLVVL